MATIRPIVAAWQPLYVIKEVIMYSTPYELIYKDRVIGHMYGMPIVGDEYEGHIIWKVDYYHKMVWLTD